MTTLALSGHTADPHRTATGSAGVGARIISGLLFVTILCSPFVLVEPSFYEVGILALGVACIAFGVTMHRRLLPLILLLLLWSLSGAAALVPVLNESRAVIYFLISFYLQMTAVLFACLVTSDTMRRLATLRTAYILAAFAASALGIAGYFQLLPFGEILLENGRARATFKDPNVFGPFLILPLLFLIQSMLQEGVKARALAGFGVILTGLFLSFSRGAWAHFVASALLMLLLMFITAPNLRARGRIVRFAILAAVAVAGIVAVLLSLESVASMFTERASLVQSYDVGQSGRFGRHAASLQALLDNPNGFGPEQFGKYFGQAPHNVYINAFVAYGWAGGFALITLTVMTLVYGFRALFVRTPWQPYLIAIYATYVGLMGESFVIDTDHWRHLFLLLGLVWGLVVVTDQARAGQPQPSAAPALLPGPPMAFAASGPAQPFAPPPRPALPAPAASARTPQPHPAPGRPETGVRYGSVIATLLFATILASPFVFIEPSAYEGLVMILVVACIAVGIRLDRNVVPMILLILGWALGGAFSVMPVLHDDKALTYFLVSAYLQMTAVLFACVFASDTMRRLATLRTAYIFAAMIAAVVGIVGYFQLVPGSELLLLNGRARATFKDPNVFGPFLVLPLLFVIQDMFSRGLRLRYLLPGGIIFIGLFLSFSRGAWGHFVASMLVLVALMFVTAPTQRFRARIIAFSLVAVIGVAGLLALMLSLGTVQEMFSVRASLVQSYDAGHSGRFATQAASILALLDFPNGYGPEQFAKIFGQAPHNTYINAFAAYGWTGGLTYLTLTLITVVVGFRAVLVRTSWQPYLIAVYAAYLGLVAESLIIDTDHWRHYFLLLGTVWGLMAATKRNQVTEAQAQAVPSRVALASG